MNQTMSISRKGINLADKNGMWKGDNVSNSSLHEWLRKRKPKPTVCQNCQERKPYDLANISGEYRRNVDDYEWLCRKCHMLKDGRASRLRFHGKHSEKSKGKMSNGVRKAFANMTEIERKRLTESFKGRRHTKETKETMSELSKLRQRDKFGKFKISSSVQTKRLE